MNKKKVSFPVMFQRKENFQAGDERFTEVRIWLMHLGENYNGSIFEKENVDKAIDTLEYIPIVGFIEKNSQNKDDFSDHRFVIVKDENGVRQEYMGIPYGVIKAKDDNNAHYEDRLCDDGITRTFLVVDGLLWNMFQGAEIMNRDIIKSHSMELDSNQYDGYEDEDGIFHFTRFSFRAACILGEDYEPGMHNSTIEMQFTMSDFVRNMQSEINKRLTDFSKITAKKEGGKELPKASKTTGTDFEQTVMEQFNDIASIVSTFELYKDRWGDIASRFFLRDIQDSEAIVVDKSDNYKFYGVNFTINGDKPVVDFNTKKRKKIVYEDYAKGEEPKDGDFDFGKHVTEIENKAFEKVNAAETKLSETETAFTALKAEFEAIKPKFDEYVRIEKEATEEAIANQKNEIVSEYETVLSDNTDFQAIKADIENLTPEELETKCAMVYARAALAKQNFSKTKEKPVSLGIVEENNTDGTYIARYGLHIDKDI